LDLEVPGLRSNRRITRAAAVLAMLWCFALRATAVWAQPYPGGEQTPPDVAGQQFFRGGGKMPRTGTDILLFLLIALALVVIGIALHVAYRRRAASGAD
jgi:hypothetical protein